MKIFNDIKSSVYNPSYYKDIKNEEIKHSFSYFIKLKLIESFILTVIFSVIVIPGIFLITSKTSVEKMTSLFPEALTIQIKDGQAYTNVSEPYYIVATNDSVGHKNAFTIDTKTPFSIETFKNNDTQVLLTKDYLVFEKNGGQITIEELRKMPNMELSRVKINEWISIAVPYLKFVLPVLVVLYFFAILLMNTLGSLLFILMATFIIWCVMKIRKSEFVNFKQIYKLGLHCITSVVILNILLFVLGIDMIWPLSLFVFLITFFLNVKEEKEIVVLN